MDKEESFVSGLVLLSALVTLEVALASLACLLCEFAIENEGKRWKLPNRFIVIPGPHVVVGGVLTLIVVDKVKRVAIRLLGELKRPLLV